MVEVCNNKTYAFDAEVGKVLNLVIHSLYTNEDIFLRELISNASDACDKLRYISLAEADKLDLTDPLKIGIKVDKDAKTLAIRDNGIGMDHEDLVKNLGTIASSGTQRFLATLEKEKKSAVDLIGQFGVGFYSVFMVAEEVEVRTRRFDSSEGWVWSSRGDGQFTISQAESSLPRGTEVVLKLKDEKIAYLDRFRIEHIVTTYSDHVSFDIEWIDEKGECEKLNTAAALWTRSKSDITPEQYSEFFRNVAHVGGEPWMILHNFNEGAVQYTNLLFIPSIKPFDLFHPDRRCAVKLYVKKVFITEDNVKLIPQYMRFLRGVVDSEDMPLNISRETLQNNSVINKIRNSITKRALSELSKSAENDPEGYKKFWELFGAVLKEGLCESMDTESRERIMKACRFYSTFSDDLTSVDDYISRMKENQKHIYFINADDVASAKNSPQIEGFVSRGIEVLILCDPVDDFWTSVISEYKDKEFRSVTNSDIDLDGIVKMDEDDKGEGRSSNEDTDNEASIKAFTDCLKEVLGSSIAEVRVSKKLKDSPVCLAIREGAMNSRMERFLIDQKQLSGSQKSAKILEINLRHPVVSGLFDEYKESNKSPRLIGVVNLLFAEACIIDGEEIVNKSDFVAQLNSLLQGCL